MKTTRGFALAALAVGIFALPFCGDDGETGARALEADSQVLAQQKEQIRKQPQEIAREVEAASARGKDVHGNGSGEASSRGTEFGTLVPNENIENVRNRVSTKSLSDGVVLEIEVYGAKTGNPVVYGATNLPDDTDLMITVSSRGPGFGGQSTVKVREKTFVGGPFGPEGGLPTGRYMAEVMMPLPMVQSDSVKAVIGSEGENLKGKLVKKDSMGRIVVNEVQFFVGDDPEAAVAEERVRHEEMKREAKEILEALRRLRESGKQMAAIRRKTEAGDLDAMARCGELMRQYQGEVTELRSRADKYESILLFRTLSAACGSIQLCVSCSDSADEGGFCSTSGETLRSAAKLLKEL